MEQTTVLLHDAVQLLSHARQRTLQTYWHMVVDAYEDKCMCCRSVASPYPCVLALLIIIGVQMHHAGILINLS